MAYIIGFILFEAVLLAGLLLYLRRLERQHIEDRRKESQLLKSQIAQAEKRHQARAHLRKRYVELVRQELAS